MPHMLFAFGRTGAPAFFALHALFCAVTLIGAILFLIWAYKFLKEPRLRELVIIFLSVGLVGLFLTAAIGSVMMNKGFRAENVKFRMMDGDMFQIRGNTIEPGEKI